MNWVRLVTYTVDICGLPTVIRGVFAKKTIILIEKVKEVEKRQSSLDPTRRYTSWLYLHYSTLLYSTRHYSMLLYATLRHAMPVCLTLSSAKMF
jgi:hypothetical protein